jgi:3-hydroxyacyl-CoA dehydrogenase/enoyl-CoA hydratase/3-hydroxybutyryl-CoA epimerase/enoyl-CoA isomerase
MNYSGKALGVEVLPSGVAKLTFDLQDSSVNKFNQLTLGELREAVDQLAAAPVKGLVICSNKAGFIVGADITEFLGLFAAAEEQIDQWLVEGNALFSAIEDLPFPTVTAINGVALGGGFELAVATDYRVASTDAVVGFPEVKLGIIPGFGGTVRLPRIIGADNANQWISSGSHVKSGQAFKEGALDAVVETEKLLAAAEHLVLQASDGKLDYQRTRQQKKSPLQLQPMELNVAFETAKAMVAAKAGPNYPAPVAAVNTMQQAATLERDGALELERKAFVKLAKTEVAANLVQMFLNDQFLAGKAKKAMAAANEVNSAGVLGAGIMGGGIAYQSALKGTPILMKDVRQDGLDLGMKEARKLLNKRVERGRLSTDKMIAALSSIKPTLDYSGFDKVDIVVEAVVENADIKKSVLSELEEIVSPDTIIASNTSTISIDDLAVSLKRPENFCGMHFFNPVPVMPLVEVIRGEKSSPETIASTVAYAKKLGKTPIVVNNCPGFLVNRILFPYFGAFAQLIHDGADFRQVDKVMERFGWPMGPAYLLDVVGIDTAVHAQKVMAAGFDRMVQSFDSASDVLFDKGMLGQKSGRGFYHYEPDKRGKPRKLPNPEIDGVLAAVQMQQREFDDQEIVDRMMVAMCLETIRCLEDGIVETAIEADMGLVLGIGFPPFRGGALRYVDSMGVQAFCELADRYAELGAMFEPSAGLRERAANNAAFYDHS